MALQASFQKRTFHFGFDARTSRGAMRERNSWFVKVFDASIPNIFGVGECPPLPGLSPELNETFESTLQGHVDHFNRLSVTITELPNDLSGLSQWIHQHVNVGKASSIVFGLETALLDLLSGGTRKILDSPFLEGKSIPINGLIWMGGLDMMLQQIEIKIRDGYRCIKLKVGGLDFEKECDILQYVRRKYFREDITIRLDANGAFKAEDAFYKINELSKFKVHSIEQPLKVGSELLPELCAKSPIPVALDEELIGVPREQKWQVLERIRPAYIILKPALHGGLGNCNEWIETAQQLGIGWWITSALESNVGLNAIAQFTARYPIEIPQGLGTGAIYTDNIPSPLEVSGNGFLSYNNQEIWDLGSL